MSLSASDLLGPILSPSQNETRAAMVMTLFGALGRNETSGELGNDLDSELLQALRGWADVVLVSAGTAIAEDYGPADTPIAILSRSLDIEASLGVFNGSDPIIVCPQQSLNDDELAPNRDALAKAGARFVSSGEGTPVEVIEALHCEGFHRIACEGGPSVYADMISQDLLDVVHLTLDPTVSAADGPWGIQAVAEREEFEQRYQLDAVHHSEAGDSVLFLRYRSVREG